MRRVAPILARPGEQGGRGGNPSQWALLGSNPVVRESTCRHPGAGCFDTLCLLINGKKGKNTCDRIVLRHLFLFGCFAFFLFSATASTHFAYMTLLLLYNYHTAIIMGYN